MVDEHLDAAGGVVEQRPHDGGDLAAEAPAELAPHLRGVGGARTRSSSSATSGSGERGGGAKKSGA